MPQTQRREEGKQEACKFSRADERDELHTVHSGADVSKASVTDASHRACHPPRQFPTDTDQSRPTASSVDLS